MQGGCCATSGQGNCLAQCCPCTGPLLHCSALSCHGHSGALKLCHLQHRITASAASTMQISIACHHECHMECMLVPAVQLASPWCNPDQFAASNRCAAASTGLLTLVAEANCAHTTLMPARLVRYATTLTGSPTAQSCLRCSADKSVFRLRECGDGIHIDLISVHQGYGPTHALSGVTGMSLKPLLSPPGRRGQRLVCTQPTSKLRNTAYVRCDMVQ
jgi:hypothetical protein